MADYSDDSFIFEEEEISIKKELPNHPTFPFLIFSFALVKDFLDLITLGFLGVFTTIVFGLIIGIWVTQKVGIVRKILFKKFVIRFLVFLFVGFFPLVNMLPEATILVLLTFSNEVKIINAMYAKMEEVLVLLGRNV